jgi:hypothetical protein
MRIEPAALEPLADRRNRPRIAHAGSEVPKGPVQAAAVAWPLVQNIAHSVDHFADRLRDGDDAVAGFAEIPGDWPILGRKGLMDEKPIHR